MSRSSQRETDTFPRLKFYPSFLDLAPIHCTNEQLGIRSSQAAVNLEALLVVAKVENDEEFRILVSFDEGKNRFVFVIDNSEVPVSLRWSSQIERSGSHTWTQANDLP